LRFCPTATGGVYSMFTFKGPCTKGQEEEGEGKGEPEERGGEREG